MVQLQKDAEALEKAGIQVIGISYDKPDVLKEFAQKKRIRFPLHSDPESKLIDKYQVRNEQESRGSRKYGICHPVTVLIGKDGTVKAKLMKSVIRRPTSAEIIKASKQAAKKN